jgi:hypothetical protein
MDPYKPLRRKPHLAKHLPKYHAEDPPLLVQLILGLCVIGGLVAVFLAACH